MDLLSDDLEVLHTTILGDATVMHHIVIPHSHALAESEPRLQRILDHEHDHGFADWAVCDRARGVFLGLCGLRLTKFVGPDIELSYLFGQAHWGHGYATEAAQACLRYGHLELGFSRIIAIINPENDASIRVAERSGMILARIEPHYGREMLCYESVQS